MAASNMPAAEIEIDAALVRALLIDQHHDLAELPITTLGFGWDNAMFRLGDDYTVRLPRREMAAVLVEHEQRWLPLLAASLPLPIPAPIRNGRPALAYPWSWSVGPWLPGATAAATPPADEFGAARVLGGFLRALHQPGPPELPSNPFRGVPLAQRHESVIERVAALGDAIDGPAVLHIWNSLVDTPYWTGAPCWLHGDLHPANIIVNEGRVAAVIDFGDITRGDPATDLAVGWMLFTPAAREVFRSASASADADTWTRARGWALALALAYLAGSADHPVIATIGRRTLAAVLADDAM